MINSEEFFIRASVLWSFHQEVQLATMLRSSVIVVLLAYSVLFIFPGTQNVHAAPKDAVASTVSPNVTVTTIHPNHSKNAVDSIKDKVIIAITDALTTFEKLWSDLRKNLFSPLKVLSNTLNSTNAMKILNRGNVNVSISEPVAISAAPSNVTVTTKKAA
ncbi:uncharacterized protein [Periplaneta americana]|uniref:uncharacterized protein n=1 Tax=Periplaneta americana TaxID=6978 RepID=UPI0037E81B7F